MKTLVVSSSVDPKSRSEELARMCEEYLRKGSDVPFVTLKDYPLENHEPLKVEVCRRLHEFGASE